MALNVRSEIGRLRRVLIHRPGREIDWMVPSMMDRLLFDDILYGPDAREEHDQFRLVLEAAGVETLDPQDLLGEVLEQNDVKRELLTQLKAQGVEASVLEELGAMAGPELARAVTEGIRSSQQHPGDSIRHFYRLAPVPNYFFQRDPQVVMGNRVLVSSMATEARGREPLLSSLVFKSHPALRGWQEMIRLHRPKADDVPRRPMIEGGDVLIPRHDVLMVGLSERTNRYGVDTLARHLRQRCDETGFRHLVVVEIPSRRSYMHLDTVFTFIDHGRCLAYLPVIEPGGLEAGDVYYVDLAKAEVSYTLRDDLPTALSSIGMDIELIPCGGGDSLIDQQREQWTDGANAFALAPGIITFYRRNRRTAEELSNRGFRVLEGRDVIAGKVAVLDQGPTAIVLDDNELSRARGGPRCMTMPLLRDDLPS